MSKARVKTTIKFVPIPARDTKWKKWLKKWTFGLFGYSIWTSDPKERRE